MNAAPDIARKGLIAKIHVAKKQLALKDDHYRTFLMGATGKDSCGEMTLKELEHVLNGFKKLGFRTAAQPRRAGGRKMADGDQARKIRALWLSLYHLGEIEDPTEEALGEFARRMSGVHALQWAGTAEADKIIKALRGWLDRVGYYHPTAADRRFYPEPGQAEILSLIQSQARLAEIRDFSRWLRDHGFAGTTRAMAHEDLMQVVEILGRAVRRRKGRA